MEIFTQNPSAVFYILGGIGTIAAMIIGVLLIRRSKNNQNNTTNKSKK